VKTARALRVSAASCGRAAAGALDLLAVAPDTLWVNPEERGAVRAWLWEHLVPDSSEAQLRFLLAALLPRAADALRATSGEARAPLARTRPAAEARPRRTRSDSPPNLDQVPLEGLNLSAPRAQVDARGGARDADLARVAGVAAEARALREAAEERRAALRCRCALARATRCPPRARLAPSPAQEPPLRPFASRYGARGAARPWQLTRARVRGFLAELRGADQHLWLDPGDAAAAQQALTPLAQERLASLSRALAQVCRTRGAPDPARFCAWRIYSTAAPPRNGGESPGLLCPASLPGLTVRDSGRGVGGRNE
jgi:hypothetical protein